MDKKKIVGAFDGMLYEFDASEIKLATKVEPELEEVIIFEKKFRDDIR